MGGMRQAMRRRSFLAGAAAAVTMGCNRPEPYDAAAVEAMFPPIGRFVSVGGLRVHYWEAGNGPTLVLVHGASGNLRDWTFGIAQALARHHRVIVFDRPGFGYTDRPASRGWEPAVQASILKRAADQIGADSPIIVGHSWGGALAMAWALSDPGAVRGVIPVSGVTMPYSGIAWVVSTLGLDGLIVDAYTSYLLRTAREGGIRGFLARVFRPRPIPEGYIAHIGAPLALRERTLEANAEDLQNINAALHEMAPHYPSLAVPVEVIHGEEDFIDYDEQAVPLAETVPLSRLTLLSGVGHMAHHAAPDQIAAAAARITARA